MFVNAEKIRKFELHLLNEGDFITFICGLEGSDKEKRNMIRNLSYKLEKVANKADPKPIEMIDLTDSSDENDRKRPAENHPTNAEPKAKKTKRSEIKSKENTFKSSNETPKTSCQATPDGKIILKIQKWLPSIETEAAKCPVDIERISIEFSHGTEQYQKLV